MFHKLVAYDKAINHEVISACFRVYTRERMNSISRFSPLSLPWTDFPMAKSKRQRISATVRIYENDTDRTVGLMGNRYEYFIVASLMNQMEKGSRCVFRSFHDSKAIIQNWIGNLDIFIFDYISRIEKSSLQFSSGYQISRIYRKIKVFYR